MTRSAPYPVETASEGRFGYWPGDPVRADVAPMLACEWDERWQRLFSSLSCRRIVVDSWIPGERDECILLWQGGGDLEPVDGRARGGHITEDDVLLSVRCLPAELACRDCGWTGVGLILPVDGLYAGRPDLARDKIELVELLSCPVCHQSLRRLVVARL